MNSPSVQLLIFIFATGGGGANATSAQNMWVDAGTGSLENGLDVGVLPPEYFVGAKEKMMRKWKLDLAGPQSWGSMMGSYAQFLGGMDGVEHALPALDEVTLEGFKQSVGLRSVKSQRSTITLVGGAR